MKEIITHVSLGKHQKLVVQDDIISRKPHFILIGTGRNSMKRKHKLKPIDLLSEMANMTSNESFAFITLRDSLNWEYSLTIIPNQSEFTTYQQKQFKLGVKSLIDKDLVKRIKRGSYMINPMAIIPSNFEEAEKLWLELSNGN